VSTIAQHVAIPTRLGHSIGPRVVQRVQPIEKHRARRGVESLRHQRLDGDVSELTAKANHSRENQRLSRDVQSAEIDPWIGLGVPVLDGAPHRDRKPFAATKLAAPLIAGNCVILKPSEFTSLSALAMAQDLARLFPPGVVQVLTGLGAEVGDALVRHPGIPRIAFIGSAATGRRIQAAATTGGVKTVTLELGGKNPIVVFPDADLDLAVEGAIRGMNFTWQGQSCGSTSRLLIHRDCYDDVVRKVGERLARMRPGSPLDPASDTGAIVTPQQLDKVLSYIEIGKSEQARLVTGGERLTAGDLAHGNFVTPALFADVDPAGRLATEEIFGPVLAAISFGSYDEAVAIANSVEYGLTASVFTRDLRTALAFSRDVDAGYVWVNETSRHFLGAPFGGVKNSGVGREEDLEEIESYTQLKSVNIRF